MVQLPRANKLIEKLKLILTGFIMIWLSIASILSFLSMSFIVTLFFIPTISYSFPFVVPMFIAIFLFLSQLIPGYFAKTKKFMCLTLIVSTALVGVLFTLLSLIKGPIYAAACLFGNWVGYYLREKHKKI